MTNPITPPPELVQQWLCSDDYLWGPLEQTSITITTNRLNNVATQSAQYGADQELEACVEWLGDAPVVYNDNDDLHPGSYLRDARRPKPSLKESALIEFDSLLGDSKDEGAAIILRALEALDD
jgi:hypothetical protein